MKSAFYLVIFLICYSINGQNQIADIVPETVIYKEIDTVKLNLHIYKPLDFNASKTYNCIVFFHGGGWRSGSYKAFSRQAKYLASRGMIAISADYRIKNTHGTTPFEAITSGSDTIETVLFSINSTLLPKYFSYI